MTLDVFMLEFQDQFMEFLMGQAVKQDIKVLLESKPKFILVHSSSGHKQALKEVLSHPSVTVRLADTKVHVVLNKSWLGTTLLKLQ